MDNVVIPRVEMAVRLITGSSGGGPCGRVQNPEQRDFTGNTKNIPLMSASSRIDSNVDQDRNDETRIFENFEDEDFPALRPKYDRNAHAHHNFVRLKTYLVFLQRLPEYLKLLMEIQCSPTMRCCKLDRFYLYKRSSNC